MGQPFLQLYVGDYLADTTELTCEEHGAYLLLLMTMWRHDAKLSNDPQKLARVVRLSPERWAAVWAEIGRFFHDDGQHITNKRLSKEHAKATAKSAVRADAGRKGGIAKALKDNDAALANADVLPWHSSEPEPEKKIETDVSISRPRKRGLDADPPGFADFWSIYPRKAAKGAARKAWLKAVRTADPPTIIAAARRVEDRGEFTPHPATWLNAERWQDEEPPHERSGQSPQQPRRPGGSALFDAAARLSERFRAARGDSDGPECDDPGNPGTHRASGGAPAFALLATG